MSQPPVAIVRRPSLTDFQRLTKPGVSPRPASQYRGALLEPMDVGKVVKRRGLQNTTSTPNLTFTPSIDATTGLGPEDEIRTLSKQEIRHRSKEAVKHFRQAASINNRVRTLEDMDMAMTKVRSLKAGLDEVKPERHSPKKPPPDFKNLGQEEEKEEEENAHSEEEEPARKKSLLEQFGYGVKPKADKGKWGKLKTAVAVTAAIKKNPTFAAIKAGENDLKARLAAKRAAVAAEMQGFESMDLSIPEFIKTFRENQNFITKVSQTTGIAPTDLKLFEDAELESWFIEMDTDGSGTLDFKEFIEGIIKISEKKAAAAA